MCSSYIISLLLLVVIGNAVSNPDYDDLLYSLLEIPLMKQVNIPDFNVSIECKAHISLLKEGLKNDEIWSYKMLDASSKLQSGILEGNTYDLGAFDECLAIDRRSEQGILGKYCLAAISLEKKNHSLTTVTNIKEKLMMRSEQGILGKYCLAAISLEKKNNSFTTATNIKEKLLILQLRQHFYSALCVPDACTKSDVEEILHSMSLNVDIEKTMCQTKDDLSYFDTNAVIVLCLLGTVLLLVTISTAYDSIGKKDNPLFMAFSVLRNGKKLISTPENPNEISCLAGVRVICLFLITFSHIYLQQTNFPLINFAELYRSRGAPFFLFISSSQLTVDVFLLLSGLMISYLFLLSSIKGHRLNIPLFYLHRILRLSPLSITVMAIYMFLMKYMGSGPLWPRCYEMEAKVCEITWWKTLFYIQNFFCLFQTCLLHSWYLAVDMQLYILSPLLLIPLKKFPRTTIFVTCGLIACNVIINFWRAWTLNMNTNYLRIDKYYSFNFSDHYLRYYINAFARAAPWLIGFVLGYVIFQKKQNQTNTSFKKGTDTLLWLISLFIIFLSIVLLNYASVSLEETNVIIHALKMSVIRPIFSIAICWVIYSCHFQRSEMLNWFLSLPLFKILSKLSYCSYLVHYPVIGIVFYSTRVSEYSSLLQLFINFSGIMALTQSAALLLSLCIEFPMLEIEKVLLKRKTD
ncbi:hypothetical protein RI129_006404 [Pyrocoelia pectoralis]|uniref:Nose resistant-to-fluoxetine protein N-terminal domain-containing protein n=1 Tax=Pyrocoelia pectoralis TaxID=417401 RepID=A0AAN7VJQ6_9COLE